MHSSTAIRFTVLSTCLLAASLQELAAQNELLPELRNVQYTGTISDFDVNSSVVTLNTEQGAIFAGLSPTRRTRGGLLIGGIPPARINVVAYDTPRALSTGMFVLFRARVANFREVTTEVSMIEIVDALPVNGFRSPGGDELPMGQGPAAAEGNREDRRVGAGAQGNVVEIGIEDAIANERARAAAVAAARGDDDVVEEDQGEQFLVCGLVIGSVRGRRMVVNVPFDGRRRRLTVKLTEDCVVRFETNDLSLASVGDPIEVQGEAVELPNMFATRVDVTAISPAYQEMAPERADELRRGVIGGLRGEGLFAGVGEAGGADDERLGEGEQTNPFDPANRLGRDEQAALERANRGEEVGDGGPADGSASRDGRRYFGKILRIN